MVNKRRGEISLVLDGQAYVLCLTLGALAELEDSMALGNIGELADRFAQGKVRSADLIKILGVSLRAGGSDLSDAEAASMRCAGGAVALVEAIAGLLRLTFDPHANQAMETESGQEASEPANPA